MNADQASLPLKKMLALHLGKQPASNFSYKQGWEAKMTWIRMDFYFSLNWHVFFLCVVLKSIKKKYKKNKEGKEKLIPLVT